MLTLSLKKRLRQRAIAVLEADTDTDGFADDIANTIGIDRGDIPPDILKEAENYYYTIASRLK